MGRGTMREDAENTAMIFKPHKLPGLVSWIAWEFSNSRESRSSLCGKKIFAPIKEQASKRRSSKKSQLCFSCHFTLGGGKTELYSVLAVVHLTFLRLR